MSAPSEISSQTVFFPSSASRLWSTYAGDDGLADPDLAAIRLLLSQDHADERRLAGAVRAHHADDRPPRDREGEVVDQHAVAVPLRQVVRDHHDVAQPRAGRDHDLDVVGTALDLLLEEGLVGRDAGLALGLSGARRHPDPLQLALEGPLAGRLRLLLPREALLLLLEPGGVVPLPRDAVAAVELQDPAGHVVEEVAVVGDRHHRARVLLEEPLQPGHGLGVEVVGRLVEQQHVGPLEEQPAERDAPRLSAGERGDVLVARRDAERVHRHLDRPVQLPAADGLDRVLEASLLRRGASPSRRPTWARRTGRSRPRSAGGGPAWSPRPRRCCRGRSSPGRAGAPAADSRSGCHRPGAPRRGSPDRRRP